CRAFDTPVVSGNVSLYNESPAGAIYPTPVIGMVGVLDDVERHVRAGFQDPGDAIILLGRNTAELGGSEYLKVVHGLVAGDAPAVDLTAEKALQEAMLELAAAGLLHSAHDCADGGLAICLAESALADPERPLGLEVRLSDALPPAALLFGEAQGRIVVSCAPAAVARVLETARRHGAPAEPTGTGGPADGTVRAPHRSARGRPGGRVPPGDPAHHGAAGGERGMRRIPLPRPRPGGWGGGRARERAIR